MSKKYLNIALGVFVALAIVASCLNAAGMKVKGLSQAAIIMMMVFLVLNSVWQMKSGREKSMYVVIIIVAVLAAVVNAVSMVMDFMGI